MTSTLADVVSLLRERVASLEAKLPSLSDKVSSSERGIQESIASVQVSLRTLSESVDALMTRQSIHNDRSRIARFIAAGIAGLIAAALAAKQLFDLMTHRS